MSVFRVTNNFDCTMAFTKACTPLFAEVDLFENRTAGPALFTRRVQAIYMSARRGRTFLPPRDARRWPFATGLPYSSCPVTGTSPPLIMSMTVSRALMKFE